DGKNPRVSILGARDLSGMPPATIITAEIDPLRSEGEQLAGKLKKAGVKVDYRNYPGVTHEFFGMGAVLPDAKQAVKQAAAGLRGSFQPAAAGASGK
ncbi:MAG TPA: alpha/beta hydrolase fold domain-containing protein, partial [Burkholderiales bacterium]|nr:alpha/beta hydrolase fold domain-containing protein [Burkholderiales bacterium]